MLSIDYITYEVGRKTYNTGNAEFMQKKISIKYLQNLAWNVAKSRS